MKSILYLYHTSSIGGGSFCLLNILKAIDRSLYNPMVLLKDAGPLVDEITNLGIPVFFLKRMSTVPYNVSAFTPKKIRNSINLIFSLKDYQKILKSLKPDIVYINTMMLYPYLRPAKELGVKTVVHIREHWPRCQHRIQRKIALKHIDKYSDHIVAINKYSISMMDFSNKPKSIVYDWIDMTGRYEYFPLSKVFNENMNGKKVYLFMGGMQAIKGSLQVIRAFSECVVDNDARLLVMGISLNPCNAGIRGKVKSFLFKMGFPTYSDKVLSAINADSRIKCMPSRYKINHIIQQTYCVLSYFTIPHANLALAESIIMGTPSIAAETSESLEYSDNGLMASLFKINDYNDFKMHIMQFAENRPDIMNNIAEHSSDILKMFNLESNSDKLNNIYKTI